MEDLIIPRGHSEVWWKFSLDDFMDAKEKLQEAIEAAHDGLLGVRSPTLHDRERVRLKRLPGHAGNHQTGTGCWEIFKK